MKQPIIMTGMLVLLLLPFTLQAAEPANVAPTKISTQIAPLDRDLDDVGCAFHRKKEKEGTNPLFISDSTGSWMKINGQTVKLTDSSEDDNEKYDEYKSGDVVIRIYYGKYRQHEAGVSYHHAKMTVMIGKKTETIKLDGGCAC